MNMVLIIAGVAALYLGGERLTLGSSGLARSLGVSPLVVGLTVVAFATSSPEFAATVIAATEGAPAVAIGNVVGSNIANIGLILGLTVMIRPIRTTAKFLRREVPFMLAATGLTLALILDGGLIRLDGIVLMAVLGAYLWILLRAEREERDVEREFVAQYGELRSTIPVAVSGIGLGIVLLAAGAHALIRGAIGMAEGWGVSHRVIGLSVVAIGTSLPELATSVVAASRREPDIALGNLVGSNVFNLLGALGVTAILRPIPVDWISLRVDLATMIILSLAIWPFLYSGFRLRRSEGLVLLAVYCSWVVWLFARGS